MVRSPVISGRQLRAARVCSVRNKSNWRSVPASPSALSAAWNPSRNKSARAPRPFHRSSRSSRRRALSFSMTKVRACASARGSSYRRQTSPNKEGWSRTKERQLHRMSYRHARPDRRGDRTPGRKVRDQQYRLATKQRSLAMWAAPWERSTARATGLLRPSSTLIPSHSSLGKEAPRISSQITQDRGH